MSNNSHVNHVLAPSLGPILMPCWSFILSPKLQSLFYFLRKWQTDTKAVGAALLGMSSSAAFAFGTLTCRVSRPQKLSDCDILNHLKQKKTCFLFVSKTLLAWPTRSTTGVQYLYCQTRGGFLWRNRSSARSQRWAMPRLPKCWKMPSAPSSLDERWPSAPGGQDVLQGPFAVNIPPRPKEAETRTTPCNFNIFTRFEKLLKYRLKEKLQNQDFGSRFRQPLHPTEIALLPSRSIYSKETFWKSPCLCPAKLQRRPRRASKSIITFEYWKCNEKVSLHWR